MNYKELRFIQEKASGLFFGRNNTPDIEREKAWLYTKVEALAVIRAHYGGDHGAELVNMLPCELTEFYRWCGRRGGLVKSPKKTRAAKRNAHQPKRKRTEQINETV